MAAKLTMSDASSAAQADIEEFQKAVGDIEAEAGGRAPEPGETREVNIGDPVEPEKQRPDDDDADQRPGRRERRANRFAEAEQARIRAEAERDALKMLVEQQRQQPVYQPPAPTGPDPFDVYEGKLKQEYQDLHEFYSAKLRAGEQLSPEETQRFRDKGWELQGKQQQLNTARALQRMGIDPRRMNQQQPAPDINQAILSSEYPDVYGDQALLKRAGLIYDNMVLDGQPESLATSRAALKQAREKYGTRQRPEPDDSVRQKLSGLPSGPGNGGSRSNGGGTLKMTPELQKMAKSAYPKLFAESPQKAYQKWANDVGPGFLEDERRAGR